VRIAAIPFPRPPSRRSLLLQSVVPAAIAMVTLIVAFMLFVVVLRTYMYASGQVPLAYFRFLGADKADAFKVPLFLVAVNRHISNIFEVPPVFLCVCAVIVAIGADDTTFGALAWAFVACRAAHMAIHITWNHVLIRMLAYTASLLCLAAMVARLAMTYASRTPGLL
jgi:hypothetical protein